MAMQTGWGCPECRNVGITQMLLTEGVGATQIYCQNGHKYGDIGELKALNPEKLQVAMKKTVQQGHETFQVALPGDLVLKLQGKFGSADRLVATLGGVLTALAQPKCFLISEEDIEQIEKLFGIKVTSASELKGLFWAKNEELKLARENAAQPQAANGADHSASKYVDLTPVLPKLQALAKFRGRPLEEINKGVLEVVVAALENGWA
jgi:hypothetical protein